jgi:hypothetical protein
VNSYSFAMSKKTEFTASEFAEKIGKSYITIWRWMTMKKYSRYLKMYDAEVVTVAGKRFIRIVK